VGAEEHLVPRDRWGGIHPFIQGVRRDDFHLVRNFEHGGLTVATEDVKVIARGDR
jgi:hypothetical protein